ncbi:MAG TPA: GNAT family N-acetyltransferase [Kineosporiaceae bacterium]|nr:GNAT family N-acetyltransferase [Kineosporiaceae bacterium]
MPILVAPCLPAAASVRTAAIEHADDAMDVYRDKLAALTDDELPGYVDGLLADTRERTERPLGYVPSTHLWWVDGDRFLGRLHIRHRLTPFLIQEGGHIGYHVIPPARRRGHATAMLHAGLRVAALLGIDCALLTCDEDNIGSKKAIEANGGLFHDRRASKLRYWVPTG